ncbi:hypothetical protein GCM10029963_76590 [Micromonospora andamanensis]
MLRTTAANTDSAPPTASVTTNGTGTRLPHGRHAERNPLTPPVHKSESQEAAASVARLNMKT